MAANPLPATGRVWYAVNGDYAGFDGFCAMILRYTGAGIALAAALALASSPVLANPGMGGSGGEAHHQAKPKQKPKPASSKPKPKRARCGGGCGGGSDSFALDNARQRAADAAAAALDDPSSFTVGSGGRPSEDLTGSIALLGDTEQANQQASGTSAGRLPPQIMLAPPSSVDAPPLGSTTVSPSAIAPSRANMPPPTPDPWDLGSKSTLGIGGPVDHRPLPPTPPGEPTPGQIWNAPPAPPAPPDNYSPELQDLLQPRYDANGNLIQNEGGGAPI